MSRIKYDIPSIYQQMHLLGNAGTANLFTPQKGTGAETKTHTTTLLAQYFGGRPVKLKKLNYTVSTAQTGAGNNLTLDLYVGATSKATLAITTQTAGERVASSSNIEESLAATDYVRVLGLSTTTASDANAAVGVINLTYEELFAAD